VELCKPIINSLSAIGTLLASTFRNTSVCGYEVLGRQRPEARAWTLGTSFAIFRICIAN
jgi:hypothetical protein